jgi:hypothetical protein
MSDLTLIANADAGGVSIQVRNVGYTITDMFDGIGAYLMVETWAGTYEFLRVAESSATSSTVETLLLDAALTQDLTTENVRSISFMATEPYSDVPPADPASGVDYGNLWEVDRVAVPKEGVGDYGEYWTYLAAENEIIVFWYLDSGTPPTIFKRYNGTTMAYLGALTGLGDDEWDADNYGDFFDDPAGYFWIFAYSWDSTTQKIFRVTKSNWSVVVSNYPGDITIPAAGQAYLTGVGQPDTLWQSGYYRWWVNPFNNDVYTGVYEEYAGLVRINKSSPFGPAQAYMFAGSDVNLTSPYAGVFDVTSYYTLVRVLVGNIVFVSATEAYMQDYNNSHIFHLNLTTGVARYVFKLTGPGPYPKNRPIYYDVTANTLWFIGYTEYVPWAGLSSYELPILREWVVGSDPATIVTHTLLKDWHLMQANTPGAQPDKSIYPNYVVDKFNNGVWISSQVVTGYDIDGALDFFSFTSKQFTHSTTIVYPASPANNGEAFSYAPRMLSASRMVNFPVYANYTTYEQDAVEVAPGPVRSIPVARYVKLTIENTVGKNQNLSSVAPACLQEVQIHSALNGADVAVSVTASSSNPSYPASNLLDGNVINAANSWQAADEVLPVTLTFDLGSAVPVYEIQMWPKNSLGVGSPTYVGAGYQGAPYRFIVQVSDNGADWVTTRTYDMVTTWYLGVNLSVDQSAPKVFTAF